MRFKDLKINKSGFTLFEVLVSTSIMVAMSGLFLVNYNSYKNKGKLDMAAQQVVSTIRKVQNYAMAAKITTSTNMVPAGGWGIVFSTSTSYKMDIFADSNNYEIVDAGEIVESINFPDGIFVNVVMLESSNPPVDALIRTCEQVNIIYQPPKPDIVLRRIGTGSGCGNGNTYLRSKRTQIILENDQGEQRIIEINTMGRINILD